MAQCTFLTQEIYGLYLNKYGHGYALIETEKGIDICDLRENEVLASIPAKLLPTDDEESLKFFLDWILEIIKKNYKRGVKSGREDMRKEIQDFLGD